MIIRPNFATIQRWRRTCIFSPKSTSCSSPTTQEKKASREMFLSSSHARSLTVRELRRSSFKMAEENSNKLFRAYSTSFPRRSNSRLTFKRKINRKSVHDYFDFLLGESLFLVSQLKKSNESLPVNLNLTHFGKWVVLSKKGEFKNIYLNEVYKLVIWRLTPFLNYFGVNFKFVCLYPRKKKRESIFPFYALYDFMIF